MSTPHQVAFIHVDVDDLWAIAECYGLQIPAELHHFVCEDALPRFRKLFRDLGIQATFFVVGRDLESASVVRLYEELKQEDHEFANHSWSHSLNFRGLSEQEIELEVSQSASAMLRTLGRQPKGFRAPGYGGSQKLTNVLSRLGYRYDSSVMAGPYGFLFRWMDARLRAGTEQGSRIRKSQYSRMADARVPLIPHQISNTGLIEMPVATSPLLRLPFQAGVCMRLGRKYFDAQLHAFRRNPNLPLLFLLHAADLADFSMLKMPFFDKSPFFSEPIEKRVDKAAYFLTSIQKHYGVQLTEQWVDQPGNPLSSPRVT